jgi:hypothetical protein
LVLTGPAAIPSEIVSTTADDHAAAPPPPVDTPQPSTDPPALIYITIPPALIYITIPGLDY